MSKFTLEEKNLIETVTEILMESISLPKALIAMQEWAISGMVYMHLENNKDKKESIDLLVDGYKFKLNGIWDHLQKGKDEYSNDS